MDGPHPQGVLEASPPAINLPIFLGWCGKANQGQWNISLLHLGRDIVLPFYPQHLSGSLLVFAVPLDYMMHCKQLRVVIVDSNRPSNKGWSEMSLSVGVVDQPESAQQQILFRLLADDPPQYQVMAVVTPRLVLQAPTTLHIFIEDDFGNRRVGHLCCHHRPAPPLTDDERQALNRLHKSLKAVTMVIGCKVCGDETRVFLPLMPAEAPPADAIHLNDTPNDWTCKCGSQQHDLRFMKSGLHDIFRHGNVSPGEHLDLIPHYRSTEITKVRERFQTLITRHPSEEEVQKYLEEHHILWSFLSPRQIIHKPRLMGKHVADFAILRTDRVLVLVEIEKPQTRLVRANGGMAADLQAGLDQIRSWRLDIEHHRAAVLAGMDLKSDDVHAIRYLLIAGLASKTSSTGLLRLRSSKLEADTVHHTFDDLSSFLYQLECDLKFAG